METNQSPAERSGRTESQPIDVSTLNLQQLRALLHEHEDSSRNALDNALSKKQSAERHHEIAREREAEAQSYLTRYEAAELVLEALRKTIVDRSKLVLERQYEPSPVRAQEKRQRSQSPGSNVVRKRVATAAPDHSSEIVVKVETPSTQPALALVADHHDNESLDEADSDSEEDDDDEDSSDNSSPNDNSNHEQPPTNQRLDHHSPTREQTGNNRAPTAGFYLRDKAGSIQLPHPSALPHDVFAHDSDGHPWRQTNDHAKQLRMVRYDNPYEILIYTNAFLFPGSARKDARAGCAILTTNGRDENLHSRCKGLLLEKVGPGGQASQGKDFPYSQKRADLRAVVAALEHQTWASEGWKKVTIATKSSYVYNRMTRFVGKWKSDAWHANSRRGPSEVLNADLWARALDLVNEQAYHGCEVQFWLLMRDQKMQIEDYTRWLARESELPVPEVYKPLGNVGLTFMDG